MSLVNAAPHDVLDGERRDPRAEPAAVAIAKRLLNARFEVHGRGRLSLEAQPHDEHRFT